MARQTRMDFFIERLVDGLGLGTIYGLLGVANSLCWSANRPLILLNAAAYFIGAAVSLTILSAAASFGQWLAPMAELIGPLAAVATALTFASTVGIRITAVRGDSPVLPLMAPAGLLLIAVAALQFATGLSRPAVLNADSAPRFAFAIPGIFNLAIPAAQPAIIVAGAAFFFAVWRLFGFTRFGKAQQAAVHDPQLAELYGIDVRRVALFSALICTGIAACAGSMSIMPGRAIDMNGVLLNTAIAFVAAALAGLRSIARAAAGGVIAGLAVAFWSGYFGPSYAGPAVFAALLFLLVFAPALSAISRRSEQF